MSIRHVELCGSSNTWYPKDEFELFELQIFDTPNYFSLLSTTYDADCLQIKLNKTSVNLRIFTLVCVKFVHMLHKFCFGKQCMVTNGKCVASYGRLSQSTQKALCVP